MIEVPEDVVETAETTEVSTEGLSADEVKLAEKHGIVKKDKPADKADDKDEDDIDDFPENKDKNGGDAKDDEAEDLEDKTPSEAADDDLDPEKESNLLAGYNKNEKTLYWKAKRERIKRQDAQRTTEHTQIKLAAAERELAALKKGKETDKDDDVLPEDEDDSAVLTVGQLKKMKAKERQEAEEARVAADQQQVQTIKRLEAQEAEFKVDHPDFDEISDLAREMIDQDPVYAEMMLRAAADPKKNAAEVVYKIGKLHPDYVPGQPAKKVEKEVKNPADKAIKNSDKRQTSASISNGGGGRRVVSEDDLTIADAAKLSETQYRNLKPATRERLLRETCA